MTSFAVVDLETTGGHAAKHRIIEIGIVIFKDGAFKEQYQTYINPQTSIPYFITSLTGIEDSDVEDAPLFEEVSAKVKSLLHGHIFVAQNVNFDYSFLKKEFGLLGIEFNHPRLCTSRYARANVTGLKKSSLGVLAEYFNIHNDRPHRALSDALTAAEILEKLLELDTDLAILKKMLNKQATKINLPTKVDPKEFHELPNRPGVYKFIGKDGKPIYIGKAIYIKKRVSSHFNGDLSSKKLQDFLRDIYAIEHTETGSELLAYLLEDMLIRQHWPIHNKAQKNNSKKFGILSYKDQKGNWRMAVSQIKQTSSSIKWFHKQSSATLWLTNITSQFELNPQYTGILSLADETIVSDEIHNENYSIFLKSDSIKEPFYYWKEKGRTPTEDCYIVCKGIQVKGYCYVNRYANKPTLEDLEDNMEKLASSITTEKIIENHLVKSRPKLLS